MDVEMSELQDRRYKEVEPIQTINRVKEILKKLGIEVEEKWKDASSVGTYSLRLCIKGTDMGQNGKGMTKEFAMASAYAEFLERFQNGLFRFRMEKPTKEIPFSNFPDEIHLGVEELYDEHNEFFENTIKQNEKSNLDENEKLEFIKTIMNENSKLVEKEDYVSLPFYSVRDKKVVHIPDKLHSYLFDTNGMCAGNSPEEAMIEGISEILERYAGKKLFKEKAVLPEIPETYIQKFPKVEKMVEKLKEDDNYWFRLVDCSFGGKYPVAGLFIIEKNTGKFGFKLGAHPDYGIAMERCFTEASQGMDIYDYAKTCIFDFYEGSNDKDRNLTEYIFSDFAAAPYQLIGDKPEYKFTPVPDVSNLNNIEILRKLIKDILADGRDILVRNISSLGFPAFTIAIPGMSELTFDQNASKFNIIITMQSILKNIENITSKNIKEIINMMEVIVNEIGYTKMSLFMNLKDFNMIPCESIGMGAKYFLGICYIMNSEYGKAAKLLEDLNFIVENILDDNVQKVLVKAVYYYACAMDKLKSHEEAMYYINILFDKDIANIIDISFKDKDKIFTNHFGITQDDYVDNDDSYYLPFMEKLRKAQRDNPINQENLSKIFE